MSDYLRKFKSLCDSLAAIGRPVSDEDRVFWVLNGLGPNYESFVTSVLAKPPFPSYDQLIPNLISQDIQVGEHGSIHDTAFFSQSTNRTFRIGQRSTCFNSSHQTRGNPNKASILGAPPLICQVCRKQGHSAIDCWHRFNNTYTSKHNQQPPSLPSHALTALTISDPFDSQWYPDTGASSHMTSNQDESYISNGYLDTPIDWILGMSNIRLKDLPSFVRTTDLNDILFDFLSEEAQNCLKAPAIIFNTFDDLEREVLDAIESKFPQI
ncbi:hypothetical protein HHK36_008110 [Tetracentron sinense]|uniref:Gag protein n=1 Tax=Tetracentron sinense TaxID=13715 RepID=A0A834ZIF4_TETSI|nr:hypothetical protein HHK36_008110 [Tetracentron sinense]